MYTRLLLLLLLWNGSTFAVKSNCALCERKNLSCSNQVRQFNLSEDDCRMVYYELYSTECSSRNLYVENYGSDLGNLHLQSYVYSLQPNGFGQTAFNVSFTNITWTSLSMRFMQNNAPEKNTCRDFHVSEKFLAVKGISLFYDCLWSNNDYEEKTYNFEYLARNSISSEYHKYVFVVPRGDSINPVETKLSKWEVFMYIDISNSQTVTLKAQTLPKHFNVTEYLVKVHSGTIDDSVCKDERTITVKETEEEITYKWNLGILHGSYFFTVQPLSPACPESKCLTSKSPVITISSTYNLIYVGIVLVAVILLLVLCLFLKIFGSKGPEFVERPSLLLIYRSTHTSHIKVVVEFAKYLRKHCGINAMVDELDVNKSKSQSPFNWYNDAIAEADFIAVVSSPSCCDSINGIYPKADEAALCLLQGSAFKRENFAKTYKLMVFMLPYCSKKDLPVETKNIGLHFKIPSHLREVSHYIHNFREMYFFERYYHFVKTRVNFMWNFIKNRNYVNKECDWPKLQMTIQEAILEIKRCAKNRERTDLRKNNCQKTKEIFQESVTENVALEDPLVISSIPPFDNTTVYAEFPGPLDDIDLLGLNITEVVIENKESRNISPLDDLRLG